MLGRPSKLAEGGSLRPVKSSQKTPSIALSILHIALWLQSIFVESERGTNTKDKTNISFSDAEWLMSDQIILKLEKKLVIGRVILLFEQDDDQKRSYSLMLREKQDTCSQGNSQDEQGKKCLCLPNNFSPAFQKSPRRLLPTTMDVNSQNTNSLSTSHTQRYTLPTPTIHGNEVPMKIPTDSSDNSFQRKWIWKVLPRHN